MEIPIQVALKVFPCFKNGYETAHFFRSIAINSEDIVPAAIQVGSNTFAVNHLLPLHCSQSQIYFQTVYPLIAIFMEGFDASIVTYGQNGTGKSYILFGPDEYGENQDGIVHHCIREIYNYISNHKDRSYNVNVGWVEICGNEIRDLLNAGNVSCNDINDMIHWLQIGLNNRNNNLDILAHSLFTITLEQQWITKEGIIQHRISTASFSDLCKSDRLLVLDNTNQEISLLKDLGLRALDNIATILSEPTLMYRATGDIGYDQTMLTTLLKDSFGGRAQTLLFLTISPLECDISETLYNLQFALKAQSIRNYVIMNTFSDNNTQVSPETAGGMGTNFDNSDFSLQFTASQYLKLILNAEGLFNKLASTNILTDCDKEQIEEWLFLKQQCEDCLSSNEKNRNKNVFSIQEPDEIHEVLSESETCQHNSDNESDLELQRPDIIEKLDSLMYELSIKTDFLVRDKYKEFIELQPHAVMISQDNSQKDLKLTILSSQLDGRVSSSVNGRRRSIQPGTSLSNAEIVMLNRIAQREGTGKILEDISDSNDVGCNVSLRGNKNTELNDIKRSIRKLAAGIEARQRQIKEVEHTILLKHNIISELVKNNDARNTAKNRFNKKKGKLEIEYEKTKKQLSKVKMLGKDKEEIERLQALNVHIKNRLQDLVSIKDIASENCHKVKKLQQSLQESKKLVDDLQKKIIKEKRHKEQMEARLKEVKGNDCAKTINEIDMHSDNCTKNLKEVQARIIHLDHVLKEKSNNMQQFEGEEKESLRHEIRNLRRTRDHCLEQRCGLDRKLKKEKRLSQCEERKLLECEEAIEAIDAAIEFKNELICGRKSIDISANSRREKGEKMLIERLNNLSPEEMRTLLYKYFSKVIDLRDSSRKLETQLASLEREKEVWEWKERALSNAVRQARLEGEKNIVLLQRQHETKLTLILRHLAEETSACSSFSDHFIHPEPTATVLPHYNELGYSHNEHSIRPNLHCKFSEFDFSNDVNVSPIIVASKIANSQLNMPNTIDKRKSIEKIKDNETKSKLLTKFQILTRYGGHSTQISQEGNSGDHCYKSKIKPFSQKAKIPEENLRCLLSAPNMPKVTRQKNKIIIQDSNRNSFKELPLTKSPI